MIASTGSLVNIFFNVLFYHYFLNLISTTNFCLHIRYTTIIPSASRTNLQNVAWSSTWSSVAVGTCCTNSGRNRNRVPLALTKMSELEDPLSTPVLMKTCAKRLLKALNLRAQHLLQVHSFGRCRRSSAVTNSGVWRNPFQNRPAAVERLNTFSKESANVTLQQKALGLEETRSRIIELESANTVL